MELSVSSETKKSTGVLVVVSAPSGCGKTTIMEKLLKQHPDWVRSVSVTTRAPREGEVKGEDYFFVSPSAFEEMKAKDEFLEHATVFDHSYGTPKSFVLDHYKQDQCVLLTLDIQGAAQVREKLKGEVPYLTIFILPPSLKVLRERLEGRQTDAPEVIEKRIQKAQEEIKAAGDYDHTVVNQNLDETVAEVEVLIENFRNKNK